MHNNNVYIRAAEAACALGSTSETCLPALYDNLPTPDTITIECEPNALPFYRIDDRQTLFDAERLPSHVSATVQKAIAAAHLSATEIQTLPVFIGSSCFSIGQFEQQYRLDLERTPDTAIAMPDSGYQGMDAIIKHAIGIHGDSYAYNTACSSSANALLAAARMIKLGWYSQALVIGAETANYTSLAGFSGLQLISNALRPFDAQREGIVLGEGIGAVVLSNQASAQSLRLAGGASNCDTSSVSTANPDGISIANVLSDALQDAAITPDQVRAIKLHGTGTITGDCAEGAGINALFSTPPPLFGLKPMIGHTLGACGAVELALLDGLLSQNQIPATHGFSTPDPAINLTPTTTNQPAPAGYYLLNHFGFGGNNTVLAVEKPA